MDPTTILRQRVHREFVYSISSLIIFPFLYISITHEDPLSWILTQHELPFDTLFYIGLMEVFKVALSIRLYPTPDTLNPNSDSIGTGLKILGTGDGDGKSSFRLPYSKKDTGGSPPSKNFSSSESPDTGKLVVELMKGIIGFIFSVAVCHVLLVLFGAPVIEDWKLTLQFSFILVCWLFIPLCLVFRPAHVLSEVFYISLWEKHCSPLVLAKWRFLVVVAGTWAGAIVVPLDWDRPWQKWPIPCLSSAAASHVLVNLVYFIFLTYRIYGASIKHYLFPKRTNKVKSF